MIICKSCGEHNEDGTAFCARCGVFLEWEGERVPEPGAEPVEDPIVEEHPAAVPASSGAGAAAVDVAARQPEQAKKRRVAPRKAPSNVPTGSLICGSCAMPNESSRKFCARCGHSLAEARVVRKAPWWRRLVGREKVYEAGTRKRIGTGRRRARTVVRLGVVLALLGGAGVLAGPQRGLVIRSFHQVQDMFVKPESARPTKTTANGAVKGHGVGLAFDGAKNTYWAAPRAARGVPFVRATFAAPITLRGFVIFPGVSEETRAYLAATRPGEVELSATTPAGPQVRRFTLEDKPGEQKFELAVENVSTITVTVVASRGKHKTMATTIAEVEFFKARASS